MRQAADVGHELVVNAACTRDRARQTTVEPAKCSAAQIKTSAGILQVMRRARRSRLTVDGACWNSHKNEVRSSQYSAGHMHQAGSAGC